MKISILNLICFSCASKVEEEKVQLEFPEVTDEQQKKLYESYRKVIKSEEHSIKNFRDSKIDMMKRNQPRSDKNYLAIDLGGSSLKIAYIKLKYPRMSSDQKIQFERLCNVVYKYENEKDLKNQIWHKWIANKVKLFIDDLKKLNIALPTSAAFTFSFKLNQETLSKAVFESCTKDWHFSKESLRSDDVVEDLNKSLEEALGKEALGGETLESNSLRVNCVLNDVVATYMTGVANNMHDPISLIIGTGTNAGYRISGNGKSHIINSEWASFDVMNIGMDEITSKFLTTETGEKLYPFEVLTAGLRFEKIVKEKLRSTEKYTEEELSAIDVSHMKINSSHSSELMKDLNKVVESFKKRAYRLMAPLIVAIKAGRGDISIIANGTIISHSYDQLRLTSEIEKFVKVLTPRRETKIRLIFEEDASLIGSVYTNDLFFTN